MSEWYEADDECIEIDEKTYVTLTFEQIKKLYQSIKNIEP
jgi:hypothetical protein